MLIRTDVALALIRYYLGGADQHKTHNIPRFFISNLRKSGALQSIPFNKGARFDYKMEDILHFAQNVGWYEFPEDLFRGMGPSALFSSSPVESKLYSDGTVRVKGVDFDGHFDSLTTEEERIASAFSGVYMSDKIAEQMVEKRVITTVSVCGFVHESLVREVVGVEDYTDEKERNMRLRRLVTEPVHNDHPLKVRVGEGVVIGSNVANGKSTPQLFNADE